LAQQRGYVKTFWILIMSNIVAIVGRPNVGKSTLFNRLTESRDAITNDTPGTTRDRHYGKIEWSGREFTIIDTGGYISGSDDVFESEINKQVRLAVEECDVVIFLLDVRTGITDLDESVAKLLRKAGKQVILASNKVDNSNMVAGSADFYSFGLGEVFSVSAISGFGTGELLDEIVLHLKPDAEEEVIDIPKFAVVGRPNVGKSSLVNALLGKEKHIVTPIAGTTRDTIHTRYQQFGLDFFLVDTAGLRKKNKVTEDIEFYSVMRTIRAIEACDVIILMLDATQGLESQDMNILHLAEKNHKGVVILVNKWDLVEKDHKSSDDYTKLILEKIAPFTDVPIIFTSVLTKQRILKSLEEAIEVYERRKKRVTTSDLNEFLERALDHYPPPATKGKLIHIKYATQLPGQACPTFIFFSNSPQYIKDPYKRYLENRLRDEFDFKGSPIRIYMRQK